MWLNNQEVQVIWTECSVDNLCLVWSSVLKTESGGLVTGFQQCHPSPTSVCTQGPGSSWTSVDHHLLHSAWGPHESSLEPMALTMKKLGVFAVLGGGF